MDTKKIKDSMTKSLVTVRWDSPLKEARDLMLERGIRHLPVLGENGSLGGILSDRDLQRAMEPGTTAFNRGAVAAEFMTWPVLTLEEGTPLVKAIEQMLSEKISSVVVTRGAERVGIITTEDMLHVLREMLQSDSNDKLAIDLTYEPLWREVLRGTSAVGL